MKRLIPIILIAVLSGCQSAEYIAKTDECNAKYDQMLEEHPNYEDIVSREKSVYICVNMPVCTSASQSVLCSQLALITDQPVKVTF